MIPDSAVTAEITPVMSRLFSMAKQSEPKELPTPLKNLVVRGSVLCDGAWLMCCRLRDLTASRSGVCCRPSCNRSDIARKSQGKG